MNPLSPSERQALKARAHALNPVVHLGGKGVTDAVLAEVERALAAHELIKVRAPAMDRDERDALLARLVADCSAHPVQHIGKVLVLYREKPPEPPKKKADAPRGKAGIPRKRGKKAGAPTRSARPGSRSASRRPASGRPQRRRPPSRSGRGRSGS